MFRAQALALYKNRPVLVVEVKDRIEIRLEDGSSLRVRDKDLFPLHEGPVMALPQPAGGGDFETARRMLLPASGAKLDWAELAELVFGDSGAAEVVACWLESTKGLLFRLDEGSPLPLDDEAVAKETAKRARKEGEAAERSAFVDRAKGVKAFRRKPIGPEPSFEEADGRFLSEIEALAYGKSSKSKTCADLGISETPEAAQSFLLAVGRWDEMVNPHPSRALCPLSAPRVEIGPDMGELQRVDLTAMEAWAIDNAWSTDPDDAIAWDGSSIWVHVADPASAILPDSAADKEALARGSTLYLPELTSPMLPDQALERFGLGLGELSPALSFRIDLAADGSIASVEACASTVRVRRASYGEADALMAEGRAPALARLAESAALRKGRRVENGAIEIEIPEVRVSVRAESPEIRIERIPRDSSSGLVREMMLLAGEAAARWAFERGLAFPFYGQEAPSDMGPAALGELSSEGEAALSAQFARRRLMRGGMWGPQPSAHRGLGLPFYAQVTSPLRRYQDLLGHMQIRAFLSGRATLDADEVSRRCALAQAASAATRTAERASNQHWTLAYLTRHPEWSGEAVLVGAPGTGAGAWQAYIPELGLEAKLRLGPDRSLDERVRVALVRADVAALESSFEETH